jgi:hypothetical protein
VDKTRDSHRHNSLLGRNVIFRKVRKRYWAPVMLPIHLNRRKERGETIIRGYFSSVGRPMSL